MPSNHAKEDFFVRWPGSSSLVALLANKWTIPIVHMLGRGPMRPGEMRRGLEGISQKMLTQTLRTLAARGIVEREVIPVVPPHVRYSLTSLGRSLHEPFSALCRWAREHSSQLVGLEGFKPARRRPPS